MYVFVMGSYVMDELKLEGVVKRLTLFVVCPNNRQSKITDTNSNIVILSSLCFNLNS